MKLAISTVLQTLILLIAAVGGFFAGAFVPALRLSHVVSRTATNLRTYDFDWLAAVLLVYALLLAIGAGRRRMRSSWIPATAALVLTVLVVVFLTKIGFKDAPIY